MLGGPLLKRTSDAVADALQQVLSLPAIVEERATAELALDLFRRHHHDWDDCVVAALALGTSEGVVASFDRDFNRIPGVTRIEP